MSTRAKFYVAETTRFAYNPASLNVVLRAVTRGGDDNADWAAATPSGELKMAIGNHVAAEWFEQRLGKDVYIDISDVPDG